MPLTSKPQYDQPSQLKPLWAILLGLAVLSLVLWMLPLFVADLWALRLPSWLSFRPTWVGFVTQPWGIVTYAFVHDSLPHLLINLLMLYLVGRAFLARYAVRQMYMLGGVASLLGALAYLLAYQASVILGLSIVPYGLLGSSASVFALGFAVAYSSDQRWVMIATYRVSLSRLAIGLLAINVLLAWGNFGGIMAHIGGALSGWLYARYYPLLVKVMPRRTAEGSVSKADFSKALKGVRNSGFYSLTDEERRALLDEAKRD